MGGNFKPVYKSPFYDYWKVKKMGMTFEQWMREVDSILASRLNGLTSGDLPDRMYRDAFDDEITPLDYVNEEFGDGDDYDMMYRAILG